MSAQFQRVAIDDPADRECSRLRRRVLRATLPAVRQLARAAAGEPVFENDRHLRACIALARLAPVLVARRPAEPPAPVEVSPIHPDHRGQEAEIIRRMAELRAEALAAKAAEAARARHNQVTQPAPRREDI